MGDDAAGRVAGVADVAVLSGTPAAWRFAKLLLQFVQLSCFVETSCDASFRSNPWSSKHLGLDTKEPSNMFKRLCLIALTGAALATLSACIVAPAHRYGRDGDRDGVPNRYDHDRDNDGVRNRNDNRPYDPYHR